MSTSSASVRLRSLDCSRASSGQVSRRRFCAGACQAVSGATLATMFAGCGEGGPDSPTSPGGRAVELGVVGRTLHGLRRRRRCRRIGAGRGRRRRAGGVGGRRLPAGAHGRDHVFGNRRRLQPPIVHGHGRRRRGVRVSVPRVALRPQRTRAQRSGHRRAPPIPDDVRLRRRDDRPLTAARWHNWIPTSNICSAAPASAPAPRRSTRSPGCRPTPRSPTSLITKAGPTTSTRASAGPITRKSPRAICSRPTSTSTTRASAGCSG